MTVYTTDEDAVVPDPTDEPVDPTDEPVDPSEFTLVGCFADPANSRSMVKEATTDSMTAAVSFSRTSDQSLVATYRRPRMIGVITVYVV